MRVIFDIAKAELQVLFYSPIAWIILLLYTFQVGYGFMEGYVSFVYSQEMFGEAGNLTHLLFSSGYAGIYNLAMQYLYLYIPLVTMNLMSREYTSGSIKMLYSSPVSNGQIIWGKFLSMVGFVGVLMGVLVLYIVVCALTVEHLDFPAVLVGLLGVFLVTCTYAAIGLFMSTLTSYQIIAALGTLAILSFLHYVGGMWQDVAFVRDLTYWLSVRGRANEMIVGLLCSEDLLYFIFVSAYFLTLSVIYLNSKRRNVSQGGLVGKYVLVSLCLVFLGYLSSRPKLMCYYDATRQKVNTLTPESQKILAEIEGDLTLTAYANILGENFWLVSPFNIKGDEEVFKRYLRFKPEMKMEYIYYYDHSSIDPSLQIYPDLSMEERAKRFIADCDMKPRLFLTPDAMREVRDLTGETERLVREFKREDGRSTFLRVFDDFVGNPMEPEITAALKRLVARMPMVGFVTGHQERDVFLAGDKGYRMFSVQKDQRYALINQGFDVDTLSLSKAVPEEMDILVIADPRAPMGEDEWAHLKAYLERGGNLLVAMKPGRDAFLKALLDYVGVKVQPGVLVADRGEDVAPDVMIGKITDEALPYSYIFDAMRQAWGYMLLSDCCGLSFEATNGFEGVPLIVCDSVWYELQTTDYVNETVRYDEEKGEHLGNYPVMWGVSRKVGEKEQKVIVLGDADALSNHGILAQHGLPLESGNYQLMMGMFHWLSDHELPVDVRRPAPVDNTLYLSEMGVKIWDKVIVWGIPALLLVVYLILWIRRRGR